MPSGTDPEKSLIYNCWSPAPDRVSFLRRGDTWITGSSGFGDAVWRSHRNSFKGVAETRLETQHGPWGLLHVCMHRGAANKELRVIESY